MIYSIISGKDNGATKAIFDGKHIPMKNRVLINNLPFLMQELTDEDTLYIMDVDRFTSALQMFTFVDLCHNMGVAVHFISQPYLDFGKSKRWKPGIVKLIQRIVKIEADAKTYMRQYFRLSDVQWRCVDYCLGMVCLSVISCIFSKDGLMKRG